MPLPRVLEPEVMDTEEDARDYDAMDFTEVNRVFVIDFLTHWNRMSPILDLGTGTALIPIEFCRQSAEGAIVAVDLSQEMLSLAGKNVISAGFAERVKLQLVDAKRLPFADGTFSAVMSNSLIHHVPEPALALAEMKRVAAEDAIFFVRDLARPNDLETLAHLVKTYAADANRYQRQLFEQSLHAALTVDEVRSIVAELGFDPAAVRMSSDRHWTWAGR